MAVFLESRFARYLRGAVLACLLASGSSLSAGQASGRPLHVASALPDETAGTVTISGMNFGTRPFVTLDLVPLDVRAALDTVILAAVPSGVIPAGQYLLTVSRGLGAEDSATLQMTVGAPQSSPAGTDAVHPGNQGPGSPQPGNRDASALPLAAGDAAAAKIGDRVVTVDEIDREWSRADPAGYLRLMRRLHDARLRIANDVITQELLAREAKARGIGVEALLADEVPKRAVPMPESAVIALYQSLGAGTRGAALDQMRPALRAWLARRTEPELAKTNFIEELKKVSTRVEILLEAPRVAITQNADDIALGPGTAAVDIVVFGDFHSAEYAALARSFAKVRETFGDRVRFVFRNRPALGAASLAAAEASLCANAQRRFWPYHDALLASGGAGITDSAASAGLDGAAFRSCVERRVFREAVAKDVEQADRYGIEAVPSVIVNGRLAPPPPPFLAGYEFFKLLVEQELARVAAARRR